MKYFAATLYSSAEQVTAVMTASDDPWEAAGSWG